EGVEAHYCAALGIAQYSLSVGILKALTEGVEGAFNRHLDFSLQKSPSLKHGSPLLVKGRYFSELPWPKRNLDKSAEYYRQVMERHPENLRVYLFSADTQLKTGHPQTAKALVAKALSGSVDYDPPEGRRVQALARKLSADIEKALK
ncbi:MAG TPA: tetratricopeptide repeat protein, partial [Myxococcaceae bacterium]|nr:tetratricopeptide repeat protein [Myxococcaceae bacterium]